MVGTRTGAPVDADKQIIQALSLREDSAHQVAVGAASARNASAFHADTRVIEVYASVDCYIRQGGGSVEATTNDHFLPAETGRVYSVCGDKIAQKTHVAVIRDSEDGTLYISEME